MRPALLLSAVALTFAACTPAPSPMSAAVSAAIDNAARPQCSPVDDDVTDVDLLFVIDDSGSMAPKQHRLVARFPDVIRTLDRLAASGHPRNYHIGVVTTDVGAKGIACGRKLGGRLQGGRARAAADDCAPLVGDARFLEYDQRTGTSNVLPGHSVPAQFACMASVGDLGCGFEMPLEAAYRALHDPIAENAGFLRPDALLSIVFLTDEDDCSTDLEPTLTSHGHPNEPLNSFRCTQHGIVCDGQLVGMSPQASFGWCRPASPDEGGELYDVQKYIDFFTRPLAEGGIKADPSRVMLTLIAGPATPFGTVHVEGMELCGTADGACTQLGHSCTDAREPAFFADPAVRMAAVVAAAPCHTIGSICDVDYQGTMDDMNHQMVTLLGH